ncbi:hypothetical protein EPN16_08425 [bacterium]|nr:MAG: hypothetical protein EPN16_08425 [bacterium]
MNRKLTVILITVTLLASFGGLVYYGFRYSRGFPVKIEQEVRPVVEVPFLEKEIDLAQGISPEVWDSLKPEEVKLMYQVTVLPWPKMKDVIEPVSVKAFHSRENIYFYFSWKDDTEDRMHEMNKFSDACALMFPMDEKAQPHTIMMGFLGKVNIWQWKASQDREYWQNESPQTKAYVDFYYPFEDKELFPVSRHVSHSPVNDLLAIRVGTVTAKDSQEVLGRGLWKDGLWQAVFKRSLKPLNPEEGAPFNAGKILSALAVWNGARGDRGGRKSISDWVELNIQ